MPPAVVEVLSPGDTYSDTQQRASDYVRMGIAAIWIIDPKTRTSRQCVGDVWTATTGLKVPNTLIELSVDQLFEELDKYPTLD